MKNEQSLRSMVERYCHAIHTQSAEDFLPLWSSRSDNILISPGGIFRGTEDIFHRFLINGIHAAYSRIDLIVRSVEVRIMNNSAIVVFAYSTDCIRRDSGEPFGIAGLETQSYLLEDDQWKLTHVHYSVAKD